MPTFFAFFTSVDLGNSLMVINLVNSVEKTSSPEKKQGKVALLFYPNKSEDFLMVLHNCQP